MPSEPSKNLEIFDNPQPKRNFTIQIKVPEFTCLCPMTGQPDFANITIEYVPNKFCIELKSLKLYLWSFRNEGAFHEAITNQILDDLSQRIKPNYMRVLAEFNVRGGIYTSVIAEHKEDSWRPPECVRLSGLEK